MKKLLLLSVCVAAGYGALLWGSNLQTTTTEGDARLVRVDGDPHGAGFKLTRCWAYVAGATAETNNDVQDLVEALNAVTNYTNPQANSNIFYGAFVNSRTWATDDNASGTGERQCTILQTLTKVKTVTDVASLGRRDLLAETILLNYQEFQEGLKKLRYHVYRNLDPNAAATCQSLSPTETGYTLVRRKFHVEDDRTGTFVTTFETNTWENVNGSSPNRTYSTSNISARVNIDVQNSRTGLHYRVIASADGLTRGAAAEIRDNIGTSTNWHMDQVTLAEKANGEYEVQWAQTRARNLDQYVTEMEQYGVGRVKEMTQTAWYDLTTDYMIAITNDALSNAADMTGCSYAPARVNHKLCWVRPTMEPNGSWTVQRLSYIPHNTSSYMWPESSMTYSNNYAFFAKKIFGDTLKWQVYSYYVLTKYHATAADAHNTVGTTEWDVTPYHKPGVIDMSHKRWKSQRVSIYEVSGWLTPPAKE